MKKITVQTEQKAREFINNFAKRSKFADGVITNTTSKCECGTTEALTWSNGHFLLTIPICDVCGDDDAII